MNMFAILFRLRQYPSLQVAKLGQILRFLTKEHKILTVDVINLVIHWEFKLRRLGVTVVILKTQRSISSHGSCAW